MTATVYVIAKSICEDEHLIQTIKNKYPVLHWEFADPLQCRDLNYLALNSHRISGLLVGHQHVNETFLQMYPDLKIVGKYGVGVDNIDFEACRRQSIEALYTPGVNRQFVAEHCLGLIIGLLRRIPVSDRAVRSNLWERDGGQSLFGKTVGIVGFGNIGTSLAQLLKVFNCRILAHDILDKTDLAKQLNVEMVSLQTLVTSSDIISMHVPLTKLTEGMCDETFFSQMKKGSFFVNAARGRLFDPAALRKKLVENYLAGAACDVFPEEPITDLKLSELDNFISTPHIAANCLESKFAMALSAADLIFQSLGQ